MKNNSFKSYNYLSESDLEQINGWSENYPTEHPEAFKELLFKHGADTAYDVELVVDTHRMRTSNKAHTGRRWVFVERTDRKWIQSGLATIEAYMASSDAEIQKDMSNMSRRYTVAPKDGEAADEGRFEDIEMARMELVQVAAVAISAIESIDRNRN